MPRANICLNPNMYLLKRSENFFGDFIDRILICKILRIHSRAKADFLYIETFSLEGNGEGIGKPPFSINEYFGKLKSKEKFKNSSCLAD